MKIEIISPEKISLTGNPHRLAEKESPNIKDKELGFFSSSDIEYEDLVFTLRYNSGNYICPHLKFEENKLVVVAHNVFFNAGKEAGLEEMNFNLVKIPNLPLEKLMEEYDLELTPPAIQREYIERFLFYEDPIKEIKSNNPIVLMNPLNNTEKFREKHCVTYKIFVGNTIKLREAENQLMEELYNQSNNLRSIGGFKEAPTKFKKYF